jgi:CheY-like chemotaxis protein
VRDGQEAIEYLLGIGKFTHRASGNPSLIFLDLKLPKVDGLEVLKAVRFIPRLSSIPVIVLTGSGLEADVQRMVMLGIEDYVVKPMEFDSFLKVMRDLSSRYELQ